jgi:hypothetical protein
MMKGSEPRDLRATRMHQEACEIAPSQSKHRFYKHNKVKEGRVHLRQHLLPCNLCDEIERKTGSPWLCISAISAHFLVETS